jgi:hypothetical protein
MPRTKFVIKVAKFQRSRLFPPSGSPTLNTKVSTISNRMVSHPYPRNRIIQQMKTLLCILSRMSWISKMVVEVNSHIFLISILITHEQKDPHFGPSILRGYNTWNVNFWNQSMAIRQLAQSAQWLGNRLVRPWNQKSIIHVVRERDFTLTRSPKPCFAVHPVSYPVRTCPLFRK